MKGKSLPAARDSFPCEFGANELDGAKQQTDYGSVPTAVHLCLTICYGNGQLFENKTKRGNEGKEKNSPKANDMLGDFQVINVLVTALVSKSAPDGFIMA